MTVRLKVLVENTVFYLGTQKYIKGGENWLWGSAKAVKESCATLESVIPDDTRVIACHPFLGGQFQTNIKIWIPEIDGVSVD